MISVGGVETAADVRERLDAGATLVQGYTAFLYRGPLWARQINRGLARRRRAREPHDRLSTGCCPRLTCGLGSRRKRIWIDAHGAVPAEALLDLVGAELRLRRLLDADRGR